MMRFAGMLIAGTLLTTAAMAAFLWPGFSLAGTHFQDNQERTVLPMQQVPITSGAKIPPLDVSAPAKTETATFALG